METTSEAVSAGVPATESISDIVMFKSDGVAKADVKSEPSKGVTAETPAATPAAQTARERDEAGKFKGKEEAAAQVAATTEAKAEVKTETAASVEVKPEAKAEAKPTGQLAALMAERAKRQELERQLEALKSGKTETPDIFTDPEKVVQALVDKQVAPIRTKFFNRSIEDAGKAHADFNDAIENFSKMIDAGNQSLLAELQAHDDPGEFIYLVGSNTPEFRQARDAKHLETVSAKDTEIAALKAQVAALEGAQKARSEVPESLNRLPSGAVPAREGDREDIKTIVRFTG